MKRNLLWLALLIFTPLYAFGDYVPGRSRATAEADLTAQRGSGRYENVKAAHVVQFQTDGRGYTSFTLRLDERPALPFRVLSVRPGRCGQVFTARFEENGQSTILRIDEVNPAACKGNGPTVWRAQLSTEEGNQPPSQLLLSGEPEFFLLSQ